jgi:cathepsin B
MWVRAGHIYDQASCGSCWAVSSTASLTDRKCIASNGTFTTLLSGQDTTSCAPGNDGCDGGYPASAWQWFVNRGVVSGGDYDATPVAADGCWPYYLPPCAHHVLVPGLQNCTEGTNTEQCLNACPNSNYATPFAQDKHTASSSYSLNGVSTIQTNMQTNGPVTAAFNVFEDFLTYSGGVYQHKSGSLLGGHAVEMIGWGVWTDGTPYWQVKNSWNTHWGASSSGVGPGGGYFLILRGKDECGIESQVVSGNA